MYKMFRVAHQIGCNLDLDWARALSDEKLEEFLDESAHPHPVCRLVTQHTGYGDTMRWNDFKKHVELGAFLRSHGAYVSIHIGLHAPIPVMMHYKKDPLSVTVSSEKRESEVDIDLEVLALWETIHTETVAAIRNSDAPEPFIADLYVKHIPHIAPELLLSTFQDAGLKIAHRLIHTKVDPETSMTELTGAIKINTPIDYIIIHAMPGLSQSATYQSNEAGNPILVIYDYPLRDALNALATMAL